MAKAAEGVYRDAISVVTVLLIALILAVVFTESVVAPRRPHTAVLYYAACAVFLWCFFRTALTAPGTVPEQWASLEAIESDRVLEKVVDPATGAQQLRWNKHEGKFVPDRAHYDSRNKRLVLRMDHYCPWIGTVVGNNNYRFFHLTLGWGWAVSLVTLCGLGRQLYLDYGDLTITWGTLYMTLLGAYLAFNMTLIILPFWAFHAWLVTRNCTMIEWLNGDMGKWDTGSWLANVGAVYPMRNPLAWILPVGSPPHDGLYFDRPQEETLQLLNH